MILGTVLVSVSFDDAEAKKDKGIGTIEVGDELMFKGKGTGTCTSGDDSGTVKANTRLRFVVQELLDKDLKGEVKAQIKLQAKCEGAPRELVTDGSLAFTLDNDIGLLTMSGDLIARDGTMFKLDSAGEYLTLSNGKTTIDMSFVVHEIPTGITLEIPIEGFVTKRVDKSSA